MPENKHPAGKSLLRPPGLAGQDFSEHEIRAAADSARLLTVELEMTNACNLRCIYCYADAGESRRDEMTRSEISSALRQAADAGARRVVILGGGEPLVYGDFNSLVDEIIGLGLSVSVFTNGTLITPSVARFLYERRVTVVIKRNSLRDDVQDRLAGVPGASLLISAGLSALIAAGYPGEEAVLGIQTVICSDNLPEIEQLWRWARDRRIQPYFESLTMQGRAQGSHLQLSSGEIRKIFERLSSIDAQEYGIQWTPRPPIAGASCRRHLYSVLIKANGDICPCVGVNIPVGNIRTARLADVLKDSSVLQDLRGVYARIKEPCRSCDQLGECYGCRGNAYQLTGDYLAGDPDCWRLRAAQAEDHRELSLGKTQDTADIREY